MLAAHAIMPPYRQFWTLERGFDIKCAIYTSLLLAIRHEGAFSSCIDLTPEAHLLRACWQIVLAEVLSLPDMVLKSEVFMVQACCLLQSAATTGAIT